MGNIAIARTERKTTDLALILFCLMRDLKLSLITWFSIQNYVYKMFYKKRIYGERNTL